MHAHMLHTCHDMHVKEDMSEDNLQESVISFHPVGPATEFKLSGLAASAFLY